ncbi:MAG: hypothetical protein IPM54_17800 [Polyangiaceae bacterium]|nr:hypothetical protein [Polyangiaceae bacterium]
MKIHLSILALVALSGCSSGDARDANTESKGTVPALDGHPIPGGGVRRLTVDELQASVPVVAGMDENGNAITWTVKKGSNTYEGFSNEGYGASLGRPDYVVTTAENPEPSPLYAKFARDMALDVCGKIMKADLARAAGEPTTLWHMTKVDGTATAATNQENTKYLVLRFLGLRLVDGDPMLASLESVRAEAAANPKDPAGNAEAQGWHAVCVALFQDPAFHID